MSNKKTNLFLVDKSLYNMHKDDIEKDQQLSGNNKLTERGQRQSTIKIKCIKCDQFCHVSPYVVQRDSDGKIHYKCDKCIKKHPNPKKKIRGPIFIWPKSVEK